VARSIAEIDWPSWKPQERATLCVIVQDGELLLMRKKRGLGAGKIVAPGGRIEAGETPLECAIREVQEELCVMPTGLAARGEHRFQFLDGYAIHVFVFSASGLVGEPAETGEGLPLWTPQDAIPYPEMWQDNPLWLPLLLAGIPFSGRYLFEGDRLLDHEIEHRFVGAPMNHVGSNR
jgi:8-oxo-dGTP diphosphatase